jgi:hypothetical protein
MSTRAGSVTIEAARDRVFDYLANPRNLVMANNRGPVIDHSQPATGPGSWTVLKFDQLRLRIEYETWERPNKLTAILRYSGLGSGGRVDRRAYEFQDADGGTLVKYEYEASPRLSLALVNDWLERRYWRTVERRIDADRT